MERVRRSRLRKLSICPIIRPLVPPTSHFAETDSRKNCVVPSGRVPVICSHLLRKPDLKRAPMLDRLRALPVLGTLIATFEEALKDGAKDSAASIAYFSLFSLFPLLLGLVAVVFIVIVVWFVRSSRSRA